MKLSIIIPMYGVEKYVDKCINSCLLQTPYEVGRDYEIICVDDGSPDRSGSIALEYSRKFPGIRVITQKNQGLSGARNTGMQNADGDYLWFVDSDDWIEQGCLQYIIPLLKDDLDILEIQYHNVYEDGKIIDGDSGSDIDGVKTGREVTLQGGVHTAIPFTVLRSAFLKTNHLKFIRGIYHEDVELKLRVLLLAERVSSTNHVCYNYLQRSGGSITSNYKLKNGIDMLFVLKHHFIFVQDYDQKVRRAIYSKISMWMNSVLLGIHQLKGEDFDILLNELKNSKDLYYAMRHSNSLKYKLEGMLLGINVRLGVKIHSMIR